VASSPAGSNRIEPLLHTVEPGSLRQAISRFGS